MADPPPNPTSPLEPAQWLDRRGDWLYRFALPRLHNPEAAEEVVQRMYAPFVRVCTP